MVDFLYRKVEQRSSHILDIFMDIEHENLYSAHSPGFGDALGDRGTLSSLSTRAYLTG